MHLFFIFMEVLIIHHTLQFQKQKDKIFVVLFCFKTEEPENRADTDCTLLWMLSPGGIRCVRRPRASSIWPVRRTQPHPLSVVREEPASWGKPRLYVSHRRDAKERRKRSLFARTIADRFEKAFSLPPRIIKRRDRLTFILELIRLSK